MKLLDCTMRDGGYINTWHFTDECVSECYNALNNTGFDYVEIGFQNKCEEYAGNISGKWRYCYEDDLCKVIKNKRAKVACMIDYKNRDLSRILNKNESIVDMIRIAFHKFEFDGAMNLIKELKKKGYEVCANAMATMNYTKDELNKLVNCSIEANADYLYIADSYGCMYPDKLEKIIKDIKNIINEKKSSLKIGVHLHNNQQNGLANAIKCIEMNIDILDSTVFGMGRGAGNLASEILSSYLSKTNKKKMNLLPLYQFAQKYIVPMYLNNQHAVTNWGYSIFHLVGSHFDCHPHIIGKLCELKIFNIKLIYNICNDLKQNNDNMYFELDTLLKYLQKHKNQI